MRLFANFVNDIKGGHIEYISTSPDCFNNDELILYTEKDPVQIDSESIFNDEIGDGDWKVYRGEVQIDEAIIYKNIYSLWHTPDMPLKEISIGRRVKVYEGGEYIKTVIYNIDDKDNIIDVTDKITKINE